MSLLELFVTQPALVRLVGLYLATGRNLVAPILAHGVANTSDLTLIFLGKYPGM